MKQKGFTLIELIATIALLGMLATILITISVKKINESREYARETLYKSIELSAETYVTENTHELSDFRKKDYIYITLQTLVEKEYFTNSLIDPVTNKSLAITDKVYVTRSSSGNISAYYDENQRENPYIVLNGSYNEYVKKDSIYDEKGVIATNKEGNDITSSVTITGTVDTSQIGEYIISYTYDNKTITRNVIVYDSKLPSEEVNPTGIAYIKNLYNNEVSREENGLIKDDTIDKNIRYSGSTPNNYVEFGNTGELWRIVGIFKVKENENSPYQQRIKLIRDDSIGSFSWDSSENSVNNGAGVNEWSVADLNILLNNTYYNKTTSDTCYNGWNNASTNCDFTSTGLGTTAKSMITSAVWNTAGVVGGPTAKKSYELERGTVTGKICTIETASSYEDGKYCTDEVARTTSHTDEIGLIYLSDYMYASKDNNCRINGASVTNIYCKNNNWLYTGYYYSSLSPFAYSYYSSNSRVIRSDGGMDVGRTSDSSQVHPSVYLKSTIKIVDGTGTQSDPYKLSL